VGLASGDFATCANAITTMFVNATTSRTYCESEVARIAVLDRLQEALNELNVEVDRLDVASQADKSDAPVLLFKSLGTWRSKIDRRACYVPVRLCHQRRCHYEILAILEGRKARSRDGAGAMPLNTALLDCCRSLQVIP
jgi:hypothetical protein